MHRVRNAPGVGSNPQRGERKPMVLTKSTLAMRTYESYLAGPSGP
jgi:hypothetical protein